jgi:hypothetical protein
MTMNPMSALTGATWDRLLDDRLLDRFTLAIMAGAPPSAHGSAVRSVRAVKSGTR